MEEDRKFSVLGLPLPRVDSYEKVTGKAEYVEDMKLPNMLCGKILRSPYAHAKIINIDTTKAKRLPGVKAVITGMDLPEKKYGTDPRFADEYALCRDKVRYIGDDVAAVAAVDEETAEEALGLIEVEYDVLEAMFDIYSAREPGKPQIHEGKKDNISHEIHLNPDPDALEMAFRNADHTREDTFRSQPTFHAPLEPHAVLARWDENGKLTVWANKQIPFYIRRLLAYTLAIPESHVRLIKPYIGGGFGGKGEMFALDVCAAFMSKLTGSPVRMVYTREESLICTRRRHEMTITLKTAVKKDGTILGIQGEILSETGAYNSTGPLATYLATTFVNLPYRIPAIRMDSYVIYTNLPPSGPQRGHGVTQIRYASDCQLDLIAKDLNIDPVEIRLKNAVDKGYRTANNMNVRGCAFSECLKSAAEKINWKEKRGSLPPYHGIGIAGMGYLSGCNLVPHTGAAAIVHIHEDCAVNLLTGAAEIGQGSDTYLAQLVAQEMGVPIEDVRVISGDTGVTPYDPGTFGSRVATMSGNAARNAGIDAMRQIKEVVADELECNVEDLVVADRRLFVKGSPQRGMSLKKALRTCLLHDMPMPITGRGFYQAPITVPNWYTAMDDPAPTYSFGAQIAMVEVNPETGKIRLTEMVNAHDVGIMINPMAVEGQLQGSIHMGAGHVLTEDVVMKDGRVMNPNLLEYKIPSPFEMPLVHGIPVESEPDGIGPYGAKECGEGTECSTLPAIVNAIYDATGIMFKDLPVKPEKVLKALKNKGKGGK
ncbi:MAG: molybdopterin-dependent oxidoreductase [Deltaproteobacteria bacterium]|nr:molybdopterin-dependent oxidoreductase [Deltaproteobacteria bacterium]